VQDNRDRLEKKKTQKEQFTMLISEPHFEALVSDAFWYFICSVIKPNEKYEAHNEFLLDRMAANYVSYTLVDHPDIEKKCKNLFFDKFYNHLAQGVYHCLKTAFPKNRNMIETADMKRKLLNSFSELFTGVVIHSAKFSKWDNKTSGQGLAGGVKSDNARLNTQPDLSLAEMQRKGLVKSTRQKINMRYSPLVERYLLTHSYETMNNVKGRKMLLTQRHEA
jgi:hypothetical protein